jgi:hypothetical protein
VTFPTQLSARVKNLTHWCVLSARESPRLPAEGQNDSTGRKTASRVMALCLAEQRATHAVDLRHRPLRPRPSGRLDLERPCAPGLNDMRAGTESCSHSISRPQRPVDIGGPTDGVGSRIWNGEELKRAEHGSLAARRRQDHCLHRSWTSTDAEWTHGFGPIVEAGARHHLDKKRGAFSGQGYAQIVGVAGPIAILQPAAAGTTCWAAEFSVGVGQAPCDSCDTNRSGLEKLT